MYMRYVISDIHGRYEKHKEMLKLIGLSDKDELYVIGDAIDRGAKGIAILQDIMERPNVHMLMGNHELMALETIFAEDKETEWDKLDLWKWNGGDVTYRGLMALGAEERDRITAFLARLPESMEIEVNEKKFYLVHGFPADGLEAQMWTRPDLHTQNPFSDKTLIVGHTPVALLHANTNGEFIRYISNLRKQGEHYKIEFADGFIDIDCGCAGETPETRLACLRLDDMEEFYV